MTMRSTPNREGLSTRTLVVFLVVGLALVIVGVADIDGGSGPLLLGSVVAGSNGMVLFRRRDTTSLGRIATFWAVALAGLGGAWEVAKRVTYASQGFDPDREYENCDDCDITTLLDGIPYLLGMLAASVVLVAVVFVLIKRRGGFAPFKRLGGLTS
jgi:hypothetical protein